ncbi:MAG: 1-(5-phosphoribosyl)-5-[(5-phosphoribosylamino)methylideneamino]imidazole-4-carboxamide isomerase [Burkholderiales bacterium]|jgi:phosphoribosylformimino-5-aminoimidazole carboxamide ribotide isomerase|nr:1-(5-phosphoribosyl)-5-[(5-phosphoribosylamino)methylideneamino]imidazole-4-carboxamide isomerase [Burkholderiales bacterium]
MIPAIDLINGSVVRLAQGDYERQTTYRADPLERLKAYEEEGAKLLHVVDLTGAKNPEARQIDLIKRLIEGVPAKIQVGGGVRTSEDVQTLLNIGAARVVVGSKAVEAPEEVAQWIKRFGADRIVLALDARIDKQGRCCVAVGGWQETSELTIDDLLARYLPHGVLHVLCTDIARDGMSCGPNLELYASLARAYPTIAFQASGGVGSVEDVAALRACRVAGAIVGRSLLEGVFTVKEAMKCWQNG